MMTAVHPDSCECCDHHTKCCTCKFKNLNGWTKSWKDFKLSPADKSYFGLLEIKCPYKNRNCNLREATEDSTFCITKHDHYHLKTAHAYFIQLQGQLAITGLPWCDFCVFLTESKDIFVQRIYFDAEFWLKSLLPKLLKFYQNDALSFLAEKITECQ